MRLRMSEGALLTIRVCGRAKIRQETIGEYSRD